MTRKYLLVLLSAVLALALLPLFAGCGSQNNSGGGGGGGTGVGSGTSGETGATGAEGTISVTDMTGRTVTLDKPAEKVVALTASTCEIVYALGAGDTLVGRGEYCDWPAQALLLPTVASGMETNVEQIIALQPDLVLMATMNQSLDQVKQLENAGIHVYGTDAQDIAGTYESILQIGQLLGRDAQAQALVDDMQATFERLSADKKSGTIYFEVSPLEYGLWTAGSNTFMNEVAELLGLENIFADLDGWAEVSEEQVLQRNPDYIVTISMYFGEGPTPEEEILARPSWQNITAVKGEWVLNLANNELSRPGPRLVEGAEMLYDFVGGRKMRPLI
ncbi:MAG: ABC transporter substrate-binding protein [Coriobacteriia bacterium]|nr:ABC transporter substrate-binding protein [Coriobacteriia bacterium]